MGPFKIIERIGPISYCLTLSREFTGLHDVFHVSMLKRYHYVPSHIIAHTETQIQADMTYEEISVEILRWSDKVLCNKMIPIVKVQWQHHTPEEATWELVSEMRDKYPNLFEINLEIKLF